MHKYLGALIRSVLVITLLGPAGCVEPFEFVIKDERPALVVEGYISNASFENTLAYPSHGRYFSIKLSYTSDVVNIRGEAITTASVSLINDAGATWIYDADIQNPGLYQLKDKNFKAEADEAYKLRITLAEGDVYESEWVRLPAIDAPAVGDISFKETEKQTYKYQAGEPTLVSVKGITTYVSVPENTGTQPRYFRWDIQPMWVYIAPLASSIQTDRKCWVDGHNYLTDDVLQIDNKGGYEKELFFMETFRNERIFEQFSILVLQQILNEEYFYFWQELQEQTREGVLFDKPPYNLQTNIYSVNGDKKVSGYFGVVAEQAKRWFFNKEELSYHVVNNLRPDCLVVYGPGPPAPPCTSCLAYRYGEPSIIQPQWWK